MDDVSTLRLRNKILLSGMDKYSQKFLSKQIQKFTIFEIPNY